MRVPRNQLISLLILLFLLQAGCRRKAVPPEILDTHHVIYQIDYLEEKAGDIPTKILPDRMDAYYTDYYVLTRIEGFFNQFSLVQIADLRQRKVSTLLNFFGNKVSYTGERGRLPAGVKTPGTMSFRHTGELETIGGLRSERIEVDTGGQVFYIYSTRDFKVRRPNISTPYHDIDYPLSDFRIQLSHLKMHLTCMDYREEKLESELFTIPEGYKPVNRTAMEEIINSLFTKE